MEWVVASLIGINAALTGACLVLAYRQRATEQREWDVFRRLGELQAMVSDLQAQLNSLTAVPSGLEAIQGRRRAPDPLDVIEQLGEAAALYDAGALQRAAQQFADLPAGVAANLFEADRKLLAISRLIEQGLTTREISHRLNLPVVEVELLASTRS